MICYRDMTLCPYWEKCSKGKDCFRAYTEKVKDEADQWWGKEGAPICVFSEEPECFQEEPDGMC